MSSLEMPPVAQQEGERQPALEATVDLLAVCFERLPLGPDGPLVEPRLEAVGGASARRAAKGDGRTRRHSRLPPGRPKMVDYGGVAAPFQGSAAQGHAGNGPPRPPGGVAVPGRQQPPCAWGTAVCTTAARGGHLEVLEWARQQQPPCAWGTSVCEAAARGGHLEVLQWLRQQQPPCPWDSEVCDEAALAGHLEVLQWARQQHPPCPWGISVYTSAAVDGHLEVLQWLRQQQPPCSRGTVVCAGAAGGGHLEVQQRLRQQQPVCPCGGWCAP